MPSLISLGPLGSRGRVAASHQIWRSIVVGAASGRPRTIDGCCQLKTRRRHLSSDGGSSVSSPSSSSDGLLPTPESIDPNSPEARNLHVLKVERNRPSVYPRMTHALIVDDANSRSDIQQPPDAIEALKVAREMARREWRDVLEGTHYRTYKYEKVPEEEVRALVGKTQGEKVPGGRLMVRSIRKPEKAFIERLKEDGGDKIVTFKRNFLHTDYTRFVPLISQMKGLSLDDTLLQSKWLRRRISRKFEQAVAEAILKAKDNGLDLSKTYLADAHVKKNGAVLSQHLKKRYIRGRGRYGATRHSKSALLELTLQERDKPFAAKLADPLEWVRARLRKIQRPHTLTPEEVYEGIRSRRPVKVIHC